MSIKFKNLNKTIIAVKIPPIVKSIKLSSSFIPSPPHQLSPFLVSLHKIDTPYLLVEARI